VEGTIVKKRILLGVVGALTIVGMTTAAGDASGSTVRGSEGSPNTFSLTCVVTPGNYCSKIFFISEVGGISLTKTQSIGFTTGKGKAKEWFEYSCSAGTCFIAPSGLFKYTRSDTQLNVQRKFTGGGFFLPCGEVFGTDYIHPAVNAPEGPLLYHVTCTRSGKGSVG
jgi:hypothetical protein